MRENFTFCNQKVLQINIYSHRCFINCLTIKRDENFELAHISFDPFILYIHELIRVISPDIHEIIRKTTNVWLPAD